MIFDHYRYIVSNGEATIKSCFTSASGAITIPSAIEGYPVTSIDGLAFYYCTGVTSVTIPDSVISISSYAFDGCTGLTDVYYCGLEDEWNAITVADGNESLLAATVHFVINIAGDIDGNKAINSEDVVQLLLHISLPDMFPISADADFTGDGKINSNDVV